MQLPVQGVPAKSDVMVNRASNSYVDFAAVFAALPGRSVLLCLDAPTYTIVAATNKYCEAAFTRPEDVKGKGLWVAFPPDPKETFYTAGIQLQKSFQKVITEKYEDTLPVQRYDISNSDGTYIESYRSITNSPVLNEAGEVVFIIHTSEDLTEKVISGRENAVVDVTATDLTRHALAESEQKLRSLVESAPFPIGVFVGREMRIILTNQAILDAWGKGNDVIGRLYSEVLPELDNQQIYQQLDMVFTSGVAFHAKNQRVDLIVDNKLQPYYFNYSFTPLFDAFGNVYGVMNTAADVTDLNVAKRKVEESEKNIRNIITQAPVAMCILRGTEHSVEIANTNMNELWGKQEIEVLGKPLFEGVPEVKDQGFEELLSNVFNKGETYSAIERRVNVNRNGTIGQVYVNFVYQPLREGDGSISGIFVVANDVTSQVLAKQELVQSEARTRLAVEAGQLGTYEINLITQTIIHNPRVAAIFGFQETEQVPYNFFTEAVHPNDLEIRLKAHNTAKQTGELLYEIRIIKPDKTIHWIRLNGKVLFKNNIPSLLIGTVLDITKEKKAAEILEQQIEERTKELLQSNAQLEKTNTELEQFTHVSSHDLQEPLRKIRLFTNLILNQSTQTFEESVARNLNKIRETAERMSGTLTALLNYTQLKKVGTFEDVELNEILTGVLSDLEVMISEKKAQIIFGTLPAIKAVPHQIHQLFYNLINNALKFSRINVPPVITIKATIYKGNSDLNTNDLNVEFLELIIEDNGVGFEQKFDEKVFVMFQRLHNKQSYAGTGIGLAVCKKVVENHQGKIWVTSSINEGSKFHVQLPVGSN